MNHNTLLRRTAALIAVPALLLTAAACGSDPKPASAGVAEVSGDFGAKPDITIPKSAKPAAKTVVKTLVTGSGTAVAKGDVVRLDFAAETWKGRDLGGTWSQPSNPRRQDVERIGQPSTQLPQKVMDELTGMKTGSRVLVQGTAGKSWCSLCKPTLYVSRFSAP